MKKDIKHTIELIEQEGAQARCERAAALMEADERLAANAALRNGDVKLEKWWSVAAGIALIAAFILYSFYLTIPAVILLVLLAGFIVFVYVRRHNQRRRIENAEPEISANRSVDVLIRKALGLKISGRDISGFMDAADTAFLGAQLKEKLSGLGLDTADMSVKADAKVTDADQLSEKCGRMPVSAYLTCGGATVEVKWNATFALASTGDCMADTKLTVK